MDMSAWPLVFLAEETGVSRGNHCRKLTYIITYDMIFWICPSIYLADHILFSFWILPITKIEQDTYQNFASRFLLAVLFHYLLSTTPWTYVYPNLFFFSVLGLFMLSINASVSACETPTNFPSINALEIGGSDVIGAHERLHTVLSEFCPGFFLGAVIAVALSAFTYGQN